MVEGGKMPIEQYWEILEELSARKNDLDYTCKELEALRKKVRLCMMLSDNIIISGYCPEFIKAWAELRDAVSTYPEASTESVTQPRINFCYACGTALGCTD